MNLKTSFFNTALFKANLKRFWWISVCYLILFLTVGILPLVDYSGMGNPYTDTFIVLNVISMCSSAFMPVILFSYLNASGAVTCLHAFPIKRRAHYITNLFTAFLLFFVPSLIGYGFSWIYSAMYYPEILGELFEYFIMTIILNTFTISGAMLGVMATGNTIAAIVFGGLFIFFPFYAETIIKSFLNINVYGIWKEEFFFSKNFSVTKPTPFMAGCFVAGIVLLVLCWFMYKHRKLETNGDIISYNFLKPVFIACVSVFLGFLGYYYFSQIYNLNNIFFMLPFGLVGIVISYMLSKKAFTLKGIHKPVILYVLAVCALFLTIKFDIFGYERRVPELENVESVNLYYGQILNNYNRHIYYIDGSEYEYIEPITNDMFEITDTEDIQNVIVLHSHLIETKNEKLREYGETVPVVYTLKNGRQIKRMYNVSYELDKEFLKPVWETEQKKLEEWQILLPLDREIISVTITDIRLKSSNNTFAIYNGDSEVSKALIDALKTDLQSASLEDIFCNRRGVTRINIQSTRPMKNTETGEFLTSKDAQSTYHQDSFSTVISSEFKNTLALLNSLGLEERAAKVEDVQYIILNIDDKESYAKITNPEAISEIYEFTKSMCYVNTFESSNFPQNVHSIRLDFYGKDNNMLYDIHIDEATIKAIPSVILTALQKYESGYENSNLKPLATTTELIGGADAPTQIIIN